MKELKPLIPFTPVPLRMRRDGWTVEKQLAFIEALAETGSARPRVSLLQSLRFAGRHSRTLANIREPSRARARRTVNIGNFRTFASGTGNG